jgi:hypothetical protein
MARAVGARRAGDWLARRRLLLRTDVAKAVERAVVVELFELPWRGDGVSARRDALAEAILADPLVRDELGLTDAQGQALTEYLCVRGAVSDMTAAAAAVAAGAAAFQTLTPGMLSLGPALAAALAHSAAVSAFPLGVAAGSIWYGLFPVVVSPALVAGVTAGAIGAGAVAAAFAGVLADPLQTALGLHQRRLRRLIDAMEHDFLADAGPGFAAREHYVARLADIADLGAAVLRSLRG